MMVMMVGIDVRYRWTKDPPRGGSKARKYVTWFGNRDAVTPDATPFRENNRHEVPCSHGLRSTITPDATPFRENNRHKGSEST